MDLRSGLRGPVVPDSAVGFVGGGSGGKTDGGAVVTRDRKMVDVKLDLGGGK